jgi:uncharacterized membrane protein
MTIKKYRLITLKQYRLIMAGTLIVMCVLNGWAAFSGNVWLPAPVLIVGSIIIGLSRTRVKELWGDEREYNIAEKAGIYAWLIYMVLAAPSGLTLIVFSHGTPNLSFAIGFTLLGSACALALFFVIAKFYLGRKLGGKA